MLDLAILVILGLAAFRLTRLLVIDTIFEGLRHKFHTFLANRSGKTRILAEKLLEMTSCSWCFGIYVSFLLYWAYLWDSPVDWTRFDWISVAALAGVQGFLHALEPGDE